MTAAGYAVRLVGKALAVVLIVNCLFAGLAYFPVWTCIALAGAAVVWCFVDAIIRRHEEDPRHELAFVATSFGFVMLLVAQLVYGAKS